MKCGEMPSMPICKLCGTEVNKDLECPNFTPQRGHAMNDDMELIIDLGYMPRTPEMQEMKIPQWVMNKIKVGDKLKCEVWNRGIPKWFINDEEITP